MRHINCIGLDRLRRYKRGLPAETTTNDCPVTVRDNAMTKNFALIGVAGYVVPRHLKAIKDTGNVLVAALDKCDSVGILDSYFPEASFFTEYERFDRFVDKYRREKNKRIDYVSICSPNYLHDSHIRFALRNGADAICEKPLVLNPHNLDQLKVLEKETGKKVHTILQLRLHESIIALKKKITGELSKNPDKVYDISLTYLTSRGRWYFVSWKGDEAKSGGIATNIGIHFFDMLSWIFGPIEENVVHIKQPDTNAGFMKLKNARVRWLLSVNYNYLPEETKGEGKRTFRSILVALSIGDLDQNPPFNSCSFIVIMLLCNLYLHQWVH